MIHDIAADIAALTHVDYDSVEVLPDTNPFAIALALTVHPAVHTFHATEAFTELCSRAVHIAQAHQMQMTGATWDVQGRDITLTFTA